MPVAAMLAAASSDDTGAYTCIDYLVASTEYDAFLQLMHDFCTMSTWDAGDEGTLDSNAAVQAGPQRRVLGLRPSAFGLLDSACGETGSPQARAGSVFHWPGALGGCLEEKERAEGGDEPGAATE